jgi:hypothetical protein
MQPPTFHCVHVVRKEKKEEGRKEGNFMENASTSCLFLQKIQNRDSNQDGLSLQAGYNNDMVPLYPYKS